MSIDVHWEAAPQEAFPIVAYRVYTSRWRTGKGMSIDYPVRLPYTREMLLRRAEAGQDVPEFIQLKEQDHG